MQATKTLTVAKETGREMAHMNLGSELLVRIQKDVEPIAKIESYPRTEGRQMMMVLAPR